MAIRSLIVKVVLVLTTSMASAQPPARDQTATGKLNRLIRDLQTIIEKQEAVKEGIADKINMLYRNTKIHPRLRTVADVFLVRSEVRIVTIRVDWRLYKSSEFFVDATSSDESVVAVPRRLHIDERWHEEHFELELTTGAKVGTATVCLTPAWGGDAVRFRVSVK